MPQKNEDAISIYVSQEKQEKKIVPRLNALAKAQKRTANWLVNEAIEQYLEREERRIEDSAVRIRG